MRKELHFTALPTQLATMHLFIDSLQTCNVNQIASILELHFSDFKVRQFYHSSDNFKIFRGRKYHDAL